MKKDFYYDEEEMSVRPPYWVVEYIDDEGHKHIATIKDKQFLDFLKTRFNVEKVEAIAA